MAETGGVTEGDIVGHKAAGQMIIYVAGGTAAHQAESQPEKNGAFLSAGEKGKNRQNDENTAGKSRYEARMVFQKIHKHSLIPGVTQDYFPPKRTGQVPVLPDFMFDVLIGSKNGQRGEKKSEHVSNLHFKSAFIISQEKYG